MLLQSCYHCDKLIKAKFSVILIMAFYLSKTPFWRALFREGLSLGLTGKGLCDLEHTFVEWTSQLQSL